MEKVSIKSEIGRLRKVIVHEPGQEIEIMTPKNSNDLLYDDILSLHYAKKEHKEFTDILKMHSETYFIKDLLKDIVADNYVRETLLRSLIKEMNSTLFLLDEMMMLDSDTFTNMLINGVKKQNNSLKDILSIDLYALPPLPNFIYTRDSAIAINDCILTGSMANKIRTAESIIMHNIFSHHQELKPNGFYLQKDNGFDINIQFEGGDILILRDDVLAIGISERTNADAVDLLVEKLKEKGKIKHVFAIIMPKERAMIHLDMIFTMIDKNYCVVYEPVILGKDKLGVIHIEIKEDNNKYSKERDILQALKKVGIELEPVLCGGTDKLHQEREQWMCGANYFTMAPGKIIGYSRNIRTFEQLDKVANMPRIEAQDVINGKVNLANYERYAIAINGAELSRGGGGARCMTMPVLRDDV
ncbi:MAG: arginine deiminase family protein [Candidatus Cloacimonadales bacterium]|jgi:arginine deiminase|nr:arginine deiminase [Candidatus Cloacimonadota bacterium]MDD2649792.1 arginine deiminase family protein [Candidatus Cloacimonadota bacterium]MDX9977344.1 arginine deiminase family protein [Candidatus Cloacimonadales bacterium]